MNDENQLFTAIDSGIQTIIPAAALASPQMEAESPQIVYVDFDGAMASYCNRELGITVENINVEDSNFGEEDIHFIIETLNDYYDDVIFTADIPQDEEYSTIYVGKTDAFDEYGNFLGLAETIDVGNTIHNDNAFVFLDSTAAADTVTTVIIHETDHIVSGMQHEGEGLKAFANIGTKIIVSSGGISSGIKYSKRNSSYEEFRLIIAGTVEEGTFSGTNCTWIVQAGGKWINTHIDGVSQSVIIESGALMSGFKNTGIDTSLFIQSGCVASVLNNVGKDFSLTVESGAILENARFTGTGNNLTITGFLSHAEVGGYGATITVGEGGTVSDLGLGGINHTVTVGEGGTVSDLELSGADHTVTVGEGGTVSDSELSGAKIYVFSGGLVDNVTVHYGQIFVSGGSALNVLLEDSGKAGGVVKGGDTQTVLCGKNADGTDFYLSNGVAYNITGDLEVEGGGILDSTTCVF